jgi:hypothetical protein
VKHTNALHAATALFLFHSIIGPATAAPTVLDNCDDADAWIVEPADGVDATLRTVPGRNGRVLRLEYNFRTGGGFCVIRKPVDLSLGENYRFAFAVRGKGLRNNLEFKLIDEAGDSVWWVNRRRFDPPPTWQTLVQKKRHFQFAWGPSGGAPLTQLSAIEFAVASAEGGQGWIEFDDLTFEALPAPRPLSYPLTVQTSSNDTGSPPSTVDRNGNLPWQPTASDTSPQLTVDFAHVSELGGLRLVWDKAAYARDYTVSGTTDGTTWTTLATVRGGNGNTDFVYLPQAETRGIRLTIDRSTKDPPQLQKFHILPPTFGDSPNNAFATIAKANPRGHYPRYFLDEMQPWTVVGVDGGKDEALLDAAGALEVDRLAFRLEPFLWQDNQLRTWNDVTTSNKLADNHLPIPTATWHWDGGTLSTTALAYGDAGTESVALRYTLDNTTNKPVAGQLFIAARPFQVLPPWQSLNITGGVATTRTLAFSRGGRLVVNGKHCVMPLTTPARFGGTPGSGGEVIEDLAQGNVPLQPTVTDELGWASGAWSFPYQLDPGETHTVVLMLPLGTTDPDDFSPPTTDDPARWFAQRYAEMTAVWRDKIERTTLSLPKSATALVDTWYANQGYILINADGPGIQPGSRTYERSWIRDGAYQYGPPLHRPRRTRQGLHRLVRHLPVRQRQGSLRRRRRGPDPVPEHDSHGQLIYLIRTLLRLHPRRETLERYFPHVLAAVDYLDSLRQQRMTDEYKTARMKSASSTASSPNPSATKAIPPSPCTPTGTASSSSAASRTPPPSAASWARTPSPSAATACSPNTATPCTTPSVSP